MPRKQSIPKILVPKDKTEGFFQAINDSIKPLALEEREFLHLFDRKKQAIVISFSVDGDPFIGCTNGYNHQENRIQVRDCDWVLSKINDLLDCQPGEPKGGRVFLTSNGAYRSPGERYLCYWDWQGDDLVRRCVLILLGNNGDSKERTPKNS